MSSSEAYDTSFVDISEFFSQGETQDYEGDDSEGKSTFGEVDSPIKELKAIILSLDWEITDEIADSFIAEVDRLKEIWSSDKTVVAFIQILRALGKYLRTHKADAHPESVNLLYSVYNNFEKIVLTDEISEDQEEIILAEELKKFKTLKEKIAEASAARSEGKANESLLSALKSVLLEIDWQITDQIMQKFDIEINKLEKLWSTDKNMLTPLQMMRAIGKYINKNKLDSHPDSIKLLNDSFQHFEIMALSEDMPEEEQQELIQADLERFNQLKEHISTQKTSGAPAGEQEPEEISPPAPAMEMPGQLVDEEYDSDESDFGHVEPLSFDSDEPTQSPAGLYGQPSETGEEVDNRLDNLFADDSQPASFDEGEIEPLPEAPQEVDNKLDDLFSETDEGVAVSPAASSSLDEIVPLPEEDDDSDSGFEEVTPLPAGGELSFDDSSMDDVAPLPETPETEVTLPAGNDMPDDGESYGEVTGLDDVAPLPSEDVQVEKTTTFNANNLIAVIDSFSLSELPLNTSAINTEINSLQKELDPIPHAKMLTQLIQWISTYLETAQHSASAESLELMKSIGSCLSDLNNCSDPNSPESLKLFQNQFNKFLQFQNNVMLPSHQKLLTREEEIKKIIGVSA